jgi:flagellar protein FlaG
MLTNVIRPTSPPGAAFARPDAPPRAADTPPQRDDISVREAIVVANKAMQSLSNSLEFSLDPESGKTTIRVIDKETRQVIRQFPSEEMKAIARALDRMQGLLLNHDV